MEEDKMFNIFLGITVVLSIILMLSISFLIFAIGLRIWNGQPLLP